LNRGGRGQYSSDVISPGPITPADLDATVGLVVRAFADVPDADWDRPAWALDWTCWETVEHMADDLFAYAAQIAPTRPPLDTHIPISWRKLRPDGPGNAIFVDRAAGTAGLLEVLEVCGTFLSAIARTAPPERRAHHIFGVSDPEGFAAMGVVELLAHGYDVARGLGRGWEPPADLCGRALFRLFPDVPTTVDAVGAETAGTDPWSTLRWATGRGELPGHPVLETWRWYGTPRHCG
jgi:hypothetical protein